MAERQHQRARQRAGHRDDHQPAHAARGDAADRLKTQITTEQSRASPRCRTSTAKLAALATKAADLARPTAWSR